MTKKGRVYDVRLRGADGRERCKTYKTRKEAERYERTQKTALDQGSWIDPLFARVKVREFGEAWLAERHGLSPTTVALYDGLLRLHIYPAFGDLSLSKITPGAVRTWNAHLSSEKRVTAAKAYRLFRTILGTAVDDGFIAKNPCAIKGAGKEDSPERPTATVAEVTALADAMPDRLRIAVMLAAWCHLRRGELLGLERRDVDLLHGTIRVARSVKRVKGKSVLGDPKSEAGFRTMSVPPHVLPELIRHLDNYVCADPKSPLLTGVKGNRLRADTLYNAWHTARDSIGRSELVPHDLRHSGGTWLAIAGATTKEIMARGGWSSPQAALRYQHASQERDSVLASALTKFATTKPDDEAVAFPRDIRGMDSEAG